MKSPSIFNDYPDLATGFKEFCRNNQQLLTASLARDYLIETGLPALVNDMNAHRYVRDADVTIEQILNNYNLTSLTTRTVSRWLRNLGYSYSERKKPIIMIVMKGLRSSTTDISTLTSTLIWSYVRIGTYNSRKLLFKI